MEGKKNIYQPKASTLLYGVVKVGTGLSIGADGSLEASGASITAGNGLVLTGSTLDAVAADDSLTMNANSMQVKLDPARSITVVAGGIGVNAGTGLSHVGNALTVTSPVVADQFALSFLLMGA